MDATSDALGNVIDNVMKSIDCSCSPLPQKCNIFKYFVIAMIIFFVIMFLFRTQGYSKMTLLLSTSCLCVIFMACAYILLKLCHGDHPTIISYVTIAFAVLLIVIVLMTFKKGTPIPTPAVVATK